ncbi:MAG: hypothetical protein ACN6I2_00540 [Candidatus Hopanoidivoransaceae bacterium]
MVQWTSGGVAKEAVRAVLSHRDLELVGMYAYSEEKVGRDAGELVGLPPLGIEATNDIDAILAARPDVVSYNPLYADIDHLVRLLEAGVDVVSTCQFLTGWSYDFQPEKYGPDAGENRGGRATWWRFDLRHRNQPRSRELSGLCDVIAVRRSHPRARVRGRARHRAVPR